MKMNEVFSDYFAHRENFLTKIDARIKMALVFSFILAALFSGNFKAPLAFFFLSLFCLAVVRIPFKLIIMRLIAPLTIAATLALIQIFFNGREGLFYGLFIMAKVAGCVSLVMLLSMTTPANALFKALGWFKVPKVWVEVGLITYRYIFVLIEDAITIRDAQKVRLGYSNLSRSLRSFTELAGMVFIRAYDKSISIHQAMRSRGY